MSASAAAFTLYPAIDVRAGQVVRLMQGDYDRETSYATDPFLLAQSYASTGATWLHLVDLDAARAGGYGLSLLLSRLKLETALRVQTGGGVRSEAEIDHLLEAGADRVVIGSLAVREPERVASWLASYGPDRFTIALDSRIGVDGQWTLPVHGWAEASQQCLLERLAYFQSAGLKHLLCTDIDRDGMLSGPNFVLYELLQARAPDLQIQASGGARQLSDVQQARSMGLAGLILGKSLLEAKFGLAEALAW